ncbi:MBL fold metallo-hydrolase [Shewanella youngdeokensis]|uniref:MBL fold metallo-hydrolase n=1 Tax=Shewanella youngdeokensis TaxID=2999068 RepID=A0ABZ0K1U2_9GAMM|nr:MBL fold metallo-hydrolase [Shewanella sp. DAU334]
MFKKAVLGTVLAIVAGGACAGSFDVNELKTLKVHSYISDKGSNSHILEGDKKLVLLDFSSDPVSAKELSDYIAKLDKPVSKVIVSHVHPDGPHHAAVPASAAYAPIYTFIDTKAQLEKAGLHKNTTINPIAVGKLTVAGVEVDITKGAQGTVKLSSVEEGLLWSHHSMYIGFHMPDISGKYVQMLNEYRKADYQLYIGGHGLAAGADAPDIFEKYQKDCAKAIASSKTAEEAKEKIVAKYANWHGGFMLDMILPYAYKGK